MDLEQTNSEVVLDTSSENIEFVDTASAKPVEETAPPKAGAPAQSKMEALKQAADKVGKTSPKIAASTPVEPAAPAWVPDFKFKVMDKEHEIDPLFHSVIKDEDTLKKVKRLHEQAMGIPHLEQSRDEFKNKFLTTQPRLDEYSRVESRLNKLSHFVEQKDFGSFFNEIKVPKKEIFAWVKREIDLLDAPPETRAQYEQAQVQNSRMYELQQENENFRQQQASFEQQRSEQMLDQSITQMAGAEANFYNERMGNPAAFRDYVISRGQQIQTMTGQRVPISQVLEQVRQEFQKLGVMPQATTPSAQPAYPQIVPANQKPAIPVIKAGGASPVSTPIKSMKDLKERAAQF
jgi:hypothetical protein